MEKQKALLRRISIYWWNHGQKKLDYSGTYKDWFIKNKIKITEYNGKLSFKGQFGNMKFNLTFQKGDYEHNFNHVIKLCLSYLGDKAKLIDGFNRVYNINWR